MHRDTLRLCFIALLQTLPPRQRAVLILKDVFEWSSQQIADTLGMTPQAVNTALPEKSMSIPRADVAHFIIKALQDTRYVRTSVGLAT